MFLLKLYQQKRIKNYQNSLAKDMKHQFIGISIKEKMKIKIRQMNKDTFMNKMFLELIDYLFQFIQITMAMILFTKRNY